MKVTVLGTKRCAATDTWVYLDAFRVGVTTYEENNGAVKTAFRRVSTSKAYGSSYDSVDHVSSGDTSCRPTYRLVFKGTDLKIYGTKSTSSGKAAVYIDGSQGHDQPLLLDVKYRALLFDSPTLTNAVHTLEIRLTGTKSSASRGTSVGIDRIVLK